MRFFFYGMPRVFISTEKSPIIAAYKVKLLFEICNIDDAKFIDWIYTYLKLIFLLETNKHRTKKKIKNTQHKRKIKTIRVVQRRRNNNKQNKIEKIRVNNLYNSKRKKNNPDGWFYVKINPKLSLFGRSRRRKAVTIKVWKGEKREVVV